MLILSFRDRDHNWSLVTSDPKTHPLPHGFFKATAVFNSSEPLLSLYVDDELVGSDSSFIGEIITDITDGVRIGMNPREPRHFSGIIEEVFILEPKN